MLAEEVVQLAVQFKVSSSKLLESFPRYVLDFSWPSIGLIDRVLRPLRTKRELTARDEQMILASSAYIGGIAYDCWLQFEGNPAVTLQLEQDGKEVVIRAKGGAHMKEDETYSIPITSVVRQLLVAPSNPLPTFAGLRRQLFPGQNLLSQVALGIIAGRSPYGSGPWNKIEDHLIINNLMAADNQLARTSAAYFSAHYPSDEAGGDSNLYRSHLILPPGGYKERLPWSRAIEGALSYIETHSLSHEAILGLALNLAQSPDEQIATTGLILGLAVTNDPPHPKLLAAIESFGILIASLRPAVLIARSKLKLGGDWLLDLSNGQVELATQLALKDMRLGLTPLLYVDEGTLENADLLPLFHHSLWGEAELARNFLAIYAKTQPLTIPLILQGCHLDIMLNKLERATNDIASLTELAVGDDRLSRCRYFNIKGKLALARGELKSGIEYFTLASKALPVSERDGALAALSLAKCLQSDGQIDAAHLQLEKLIAPSPTAATLRARLLRIELFEQQKQFELMLEETHAAYLLAPQDAAVFGAAVRCAVRQLMQIPASEQNGEPH